MSSSQPSQPPKQAAYNTPKNPISHLPSEQRETIPRKYGDPVPAIRRSADSNPSDPVSLARLEKKKQRSAQHLQNANVDLEYGVEQQPSEGDIADAVEHKSERARAQAGAHAGPVGSARGPGYPGFGEERELAADMGRKREEHDRVLGERVRDSPVGGAGAEKEVVRERKLKLDESLDVKGAVSEGTGDPVVGE